MLPRGPHHQTYGVATIPPWGVDFGDGIARHPTQVGEIAFLAALAALLAMAYALQARSVRGGRFLGHVQVQLLSRIVALRVLRIERASPPRTSAEHASLGRALYAAITRMCWVTDWIANADDHTAVSRLIADGFRSV